MAKRPYSFLKDPYIVAVIILTFVGFFLRFYRLEDFMIFLGDQGRDASIIRNILLLKHFPAIGPVTSIGNVYLGPFYYYFMAPWLLLFNFNPLGLAVGVVFYSSLFVPLAYGLITDLFDKKIALVTTILIAFSAVLVDLSRYSWNPNLLAMASLLSFYFLVKALKTRKLHYYFLTGALLSITTQLHYIALSLLPTTLIIIAIDYVAHRYLLKSQLKRWIVGLGAFFLFSFPLVIFDMKHNFLNSKNFLTLFIQTGAIRSHRFSDLFATFTRLSELSLSTPVTAFYSLVLLILFLGIAIVLLKKPIPYQALTLYFLLPFLATTMYSGVKHPHYLGNLYPFYYLLIAYVLAQVFWNKKWWPLLVGFIILFIVANSDDYYFLSERGSNQMESAKKVAKVIYSNTKGETYRLTSLPERYFDSTYRYYLELWDAPPLSKDSIEQTEKLIVVCYDPCRPMDDPQWDVALFAPKKIENTWIIDGTTIYKLDH